MIGCVAMSGPHPSPHFRDSCSCVSSSALDTDTLLMLARLHVQGGNAVCSNSTHTSVLYVSAQRCKVTCCIVCICTYLLTYVCVSVCTYVGWIGRCITHTASSSFFSMVLAAKWLRTSPSRSRLASCSCCSCCLAEMSEASSSYSRKRTAGKE